MIAYTPPSETVNVSAGGMPCPLYRAFKYPYGRTVVIEPCSAMLPVPASQFCITPYRPTFAGPFIVGARQLQPTAATWPSWGSSSTACL